MCFKSFQSESDVVIKNFFRNLKNKNRVLITTVLKSFNTEDSHYFPNGGSKSNTLDTNSHSPHNDSSTLFSSSIFSSTFSLYSDTYFGWITCTFALTIFALSLSANINSFQNSFCLSFSRIKLDGMKLLYDKILFLMASKFEIAICCIVLTFDLRI